MICRGDAFQEIEVIKVGFIRSQEKSDTVIGVFFCVFEGITPLFRSLELSFIKIAETQVVDNMTWVMLPRAIFLIKIFSLGIRNHLKGMRYSIMDMHSINCERASWGDVEVSSDFIDGNESGKITSFMTLTQQILLITILA